VKVNRTKQAGTSATTAAAENLDGGRVQIQLLRLKNFGSLRYASPDVDESVSARG
jgi:hypothetical protein